MRHRSYYRFAPVLAIWFAYMTFKTRGKSPRSTLALAMIIPPGFVGPEIAQNC